MSHLVRPAGAVAAGVGAFCYGIPAANAALRTVRMMCRMGYNQFFKPEDKKPERNPQPEANKEELGFLMKFCSSCVSLVLDSLTLPEIPKEPSKKQVTSWGWDFVKFSVVAIALHTVAVKLGGPAPLNGVLRYGSVVNLTPDLYPIVQWAGKFVPPFMKGSA